MHTTDVAYLTLEEVLLLHARLIQRTALTATGLFLELNRFTMTASNEEALDFTRRAAVGEIDVASMATWLETHCQAIDNPRPASRPSNN